MIDRMREGLRKLVRSEVGAIDTLAMYPAEVIKQNADGTLEVKPDDRRFGPGLTHLSIHTGIPGVTMTVPKGARILIGFTNGRRDQPIAHLWESGTPITLKIEATTSIAIETSGTVELGQDPKLGVARMTDAVQAGPWSGAIVGGSLRVKAGL